MTPTTIFIHIPKTGGTSLRSLFEDHYGDHLLRVYRSGPEPRVHPDEIDSITPEQAAAPAVFGHFAFGIHEHLPGEARYAAVLRDPVMRVVSHYYLYVRRFARGNTSGNRLEMAIARGELTLADFARGNIPRKRKRPLPPPSQNLMTRFLSGHYPPCPTTPDDPALLETAKQNIMDHFLIVGLTEQLPRFMALLGTELGWRQVPDPGHMNVNPNRPERDALEPEAIEAIREHNALDLALYDFVAEITEGGTRLAPGVGRRRGRFLKR